MRSFMLLASTPQMHLLEPRRLLALPTADADPSHLLAVGGTLYFSANDADHGFELWKSDGTEAGTVLVKDILHGQGSSDPHNLVAIGNNVYFNVTDAAGHVQLWTSDGTATGTMLVADLCSLAAITQSGDTVVLDNVLYITAHDGDEFSALFKSDGTSSEVVKEFTGPHVQDLIAADNVLYLSAPDPTHGRELWKSDGTEAGTVLVKDINPGTANSNPFSFTSDFVVLNGAIYFAATTTTNGTELWKSDGTGAGTVLVKDINPQGSAGVGGFVTLNGAIFFSAEDPEHGRELWRSDGTAAGTVLLKDINPGLEESAPAPLGFRLLAAAGMLYFSAGDGTHGRELWKSDGTSAGTVLVKDIQPGNSGSVPRAFASLNGLLYFSATDGDQFDSPPGHGFEYWKSDGTEFGTELLKDINPGTGHSALGFEPQIVVGNGSVFFAADDGTHGVELWRSDGTTEGTTLLADINLQGPPFPFTRFSLETRVWQVFGSDRDDRIDVTISDGTYFATRNGITESIDVSQVSQVHIFGNGGNDRIIASTVTLPVPGAPGMRIEGGEGDDTIYGTQHNDHILGQAGSDRIYGGGGGDTIFGGDGRDFLYGETGYDSIHGGDGHDYIVGGDGKDRLWGDAGKDRIYGGLSDDQIDGGTERDRIFGEAGNDKIFGNRGSDTLDGGDGTDYIDAGRDHDLILAADGFRDTIFAGGGTDSGEVDEELDLIDGLELLI